MKNRALIFGSVGAIVLGIALVARNSSAASTPEPGTPKPSGGGGGGGGGGASLPKPNVIEAGSSAEVITRNDPLALRSAPSTSSAKIAEMGPGEIVFVTGPLQSNFYPVTWNGKSGFAYGGYVKALVFGPPSPGTSVEAVATSSAVPTPPPAPVGPKLLTWPAQMKPGARYRATIQLDFAHAALATKARVISELASDGFSNVDASGEGASWVATGTWAKGAESFDKPDEVAEAWEIG